MSALHEHIGRLLDAERRTLTTALQDSTYAQRAAFFEWLKSRWCLHCGAADPGCRCWDDD